MHRALGTLNAAFDHARVELHGVYAYERLRDLTAYEQRAGSRSRAAQLALLTPVPCLIVLLAIDALPLVPITRGLNHQTVGFWFRSALAGVTMTCITITTTTQSVPALPMTSTRACAICAAIGIVLLPTGYVFGLLIGFPIPFALQLQTPLWLALVGAALHASWKDTIRADPRTRQDLRRVLQVFNALVTVIIVYAAFTCLFMQLRPNVQTFVSCLLPFMKIAFKNWVDKGLRHSPNLKPLYSVFNVDIFHTMFVASAMQQTAAGASLGIVVAVDVAQAAVAVYEVASVVRAVRRTQAETRAQRAEMCASDPLLRRRLVFETTLGPLAYALHILETSERVRECLAVERETKAGTSDGLARLPYLVVDEGEPVHNPSRSPPGPPSTAPRLARIVPVRSQKPGNWDTAQHDQREADPELDTARAVLKILFMTEFYVLTEYVEAVVAIVYGVYLHTLSYLPNRIYYTQLATLSPDDQRDKARHVLLYALYELLSFVALCVAVDRVMERFSLVGQLGFVLEKHGWLVQILLLIWILFVVQSTLEPLGTDYTFQFKWLKSS